MGCTTANTIVCEDIGGECTKKCDAGTSPIQTPTNCEWGMACCIRNSASQW